MTYQKQIKDPRWQKRRLEIMERDEFTCQSCFNKKDTLNVHHRIYYKDRDLWDYNDDELETLCDRCHKRITEIKKRIKIIIDKRFIECDYLLNLEKLLLNTTHFLLCDYIKFIDMAKLVNKKNKRKSDLCRKKLGL
jgi:hypothetical protein